MPFLFERIRSTPETDKVESGLTKAAEEHAGTVHEARSWRSAYEWMTGHARHLERQVIEARAALDGDGSVER